ncbi:hypothetical protein HYW21_02675 [Candidatus Woesearchaeota archaeon]|nr:hypothetical protein [Candidatus Woesearchaeota archaeon]
MTITITVSCKDGIIMFADRKITSLSQGTNYSRDKLVRFARVACSYHGLANGADGSPMFKAISRAVDSNDANVDIIAEKLFFFLNNEELPRRCLDESGIYVAGFDDLGQPQVYHLFFHKNIGNVKKELYNVEHHDKGGNYIKKPKRQNYFALFNGANSAVGVMQWNNPLEYEKLTFEEVLKEIKKQLEVTCRTEPYSGVCGDGLNYVTIPTLSKRVSDINSLEQTKESIPAVKGIPTNKQEHDKYLEEIPNGMPPSGSKISFD